MAEYRVVEKEWLDQMANVIRSKTGSDELMPREAFIPAVEGISGGIQISEHIIDRDMLSTGSGGNSANFLQTFMPDTESIRNASVAIVSNTYTEGNYGRYAVCARIGNSIYKNIFRGANASNAGIGTNYDFFIGAGSVVTVFAF